MRYDGVYHRDVMWMRYYVLIHLFFLRCAICFWEKNHL